jgi:hypothetical protein
MFTTALSVLSPASLWAMMATVMPIRAAEWLAVTVWVVGGVRRCGNVLEQDVSAT